MLMITLSSFSALAQNPDQPKPRLIVGIVVDQMRYDYLTRYWHRYGTEGFRKLFREGHAFTNTHFNYVPTYTGPGHASIYTGCTPSAHGIISNNWYDRKQKKVIYVTDDSLVKGVGTMAAAGKMSPRPMISTTISDELRIASNMRSKVVGIALKDRGAILPAGHSANGAYWYEGATGNWISSSWYMDALPPWVQSFNKDSVAKKLLKEIWTPLLPTDQYKESTSDEVAYEDLLAGHTRPVFPYNFAQNAPGNFDVIKYIPAGNTLTKEFALAALRGEQLGKDEFTDILAISFSSPDYAGHQFGTHAIEMQDMYLRLDLELADLIRQIENEVGKGQVLFFLTADHAAIPNPQFLLDRKIPAGIFNITQVKDSLVRYMNSRYGMQSWILALEDDQVYLDHQLLSKNKLDYEEVCDDLAKVLLGFDGVAYTLTASDLQKGEFTFGIRSLVQKGFYPKRSGDVVLMLEPGLIEYKAKGSTHGSAYTYDTHVPLIFYGAGISKGITTRFVEITDIAPTLAQMLGIQPPNTATGKTLEEVFGIR